MGLTNEEIQQLADGEILPRPLTPQEVALLSEEPYRMLMPRLEGEEVKADGTD